MDVTLGQVVYSKAGRDATRRFIITGIIDALYVQISDGDLRKIEKPKKKKIKHLVLTGDVIEAIGTKLENGQKVTNAEIRKALAALDNESERDK